MINKDLLAKLSAQMKLPMPEYIHTDVAIEISRDIETISKIEPYHLPEITKLICGCEELKNQFDEKYGIVSRFYVDSSLESMRAVFSDKSCDSNFFIGLVFPLADLTIINAFIEAFDQLEKEISTTSQEISKKQETIESLHKKIEVKEIELSETEKEKASSIKGYLTKKKKKKEKEQKDLEDYRIKYETLSDQKNRLDMAYGEAQKKKENYDAELSKSRNNAYDIFSKKDDISSTIEQIWNCTAKPDELSSKLKCYDFANQFLTTLFDNHISHAVATLAKLYEDNIIDIYDAPFYIYLEKNEDATTQYFFATYLSASNGDFDSGKADFDSWINFIIEKSIQERPDLKFSTFWNGIRSKNNWLIALNRVREFIDNGVSDFVVRLFLSTNGKAREHLISSVQKEIEDGMISFTEIISALIENHVPGDECSAFAELFVQKMETKNRKLCEENEHLKFSVNRVPSKICGAMSKPIEELEILASNLSTTTANISPRLVSSKLEKGLISLLKSLEVFGVYPLEDADFWCEKKPIPYDTRHHSINLSEPPKTVYLRTLGFAYCDAEGNDKEIAAIVGELQEENPKRENKSKIRCKQKIRRKVNISEKKHKNKIQKKVTKRK